MRKRTITKNICAPHYERNFIFSKNYNVFYFLKDILFAFFTIPFTRVKEKSIHLKFEDGWFTQFFYKHLTQNVIFHVKSHVTKRVATVLSIINTKMTASQVTKFETWNDTSLKKLGEWVADASVSGGSYKRRLVESQCNPFFSYFKIFLFRSRKKKFL